MTDTFRSRLKQRMDELQMNPFSTAQRAGVGEDFIRDVLRGKTRDPGVEKVAKVAEALETTVDELLGTTRQRINIDLRQIAASVQALPVIGRVSASHWWYVEDGDIPSENWGTVPSVSGYPVDWQFGMIVEGNCLNKIARHGDRLVCLDVVKASYEPQDNDLVVVERTRFGGQMLQRTAKRLRRIDGRYELWPESDDPAHQEPLTFDVVEGDEVRVFAKVLWILKTP